MTDDEIRDEAISNATGKYGEEAFSYLVVGTITQQLGIEDELVTSELVHEWLRQFRLAISNTVGYAGAIVRQDPGANSKGGPCVAPAPTRRCPAEVSWHDEDEVGGGGSHR